MTIHYQGHGVTLHHGDCLDVLRTLPDASVDSVVTDPPYSLTDRREQYCAGDVLRDAIIMDAQHADAERTKSLVTLRITVAPSLAMRVRGVHLDRHVAAGEEEVDDDSAAGRQDDDVLVDEGDAVAGEERLGGLFRLWVRQGVSRCIGACRCLGQHGDGLIRVPVRLRHDALGEAEGSPGIVALGGAELAAVLALDVARLTGELLPASGADALDQPFELLCPEEVGAGAGARRLASVTEAGGVGGVGDSADRALSFDLVAHRAILSWRPTVLRGFMSSLWDGTGVETDTRLWRECLRVLKPGGHCLAFGSPRTWHNLQTAIERSGFEVRDGIAWLSGSGFPKSLDVSKAIDKRANVNDETHRRIALVAEVIRTHREAKGMERSAVSLAVVGTPSGACWNWEHQQLPSAEMWPAIKRALDIPDKFDGLIEGTRAQFIGAEREVIGERTTGLGTGRGAVAYIGDSDNRDVTAPATPAAARWQGWGTALKPAFEPVVVARKPLIGTVAATVLEHGTGALNIGACRIGLASGEDVAALNARSGGRRGFASEYVGGTDRPLPPGADLSKGRWPANVVLDEYREPVLRLRYNLPTEVERTIRESFGASTSHLPAVPGVDHSAPEQGGSSEVLLPRLPGALDVGEPDGRAGSEVGQAAHARDSGADLRDEAGQPTDGRERAELEWRPIPEQGVRLRESVDPAPARARDVRLDVDAEWGEVHPGASPSRGAATREGADLRGDRSPHQRRKGGQPPRESGAPRVEQFAPDEARRGGRGDVPAATGERGATASPLTVLRRECPPGWWHYFDLVGHRREGQAEALDEQSGTLTSGLMRAGTKPKGERETYGQDAAAGYETTRDTPGDSGGASRFFYVAKADASERPRLPKRSLRLRDDLTPEQVDHVRARLVEAGVQVD